MALTGRIRRGRPQGSPLRSIRFAAPGRARERTVGDGLVPSRCQGRTSGTGDRKGRPHDPYDCRPASRTRTNRRGRACPVPLPRAPVRPARATARVAPTIHTIAAPRRARERTVGDGLVPSRCHGRRYVRHGRPRGSPLRLGRGPTVLCYQAVTSPAMVPVRQATRVPERIARGPRRRSSVRRSGTRTLMPPIRIPRLPKFANPHSA